MQIFISHISEEKSLALVLKDWLESAFLSQCKVFVSSDPDDIPAGTKWLEQIDGALEESKLLIILYSPQSRLRPWINFEAGCGWIKKIPIMPVCHSGLKVSEIGSPISSFQGLEIEDKDFSNNFFGAIAKHAGFAKTPRISVEEFLKEIKEAIGGIDQVQLPKQKEVEKSDLTEEQIKILKYLAQAEDSDQGGVDEPVIASALGMKVTILRHHIQPLVNKQYVYQGHVMGSPTYFSIDQNGITYLVEHGLHE